MNKTLVITLFALFTLTTTAFAQGQFDGNWSGLGKATNQEGDIYPPCSMEFEFLQSATEFQIVSGGYNCGFTRVYKPFSFEIHGNNLVSQGATVGTLINGVLHALVPQAGFTTEYTIQLSGPQLSYEEKLDLGGGQYVDVRGNLDKQP